MTTLLDAGYFHIMQQGFPLENQGDAVRLPYQQDMAYIVHLKAGKQFTPPQNYKGGFADFADPDSKTRRFILLRPAKNNTVTIDKDMIGDVQRLTVRPSATEIQSLEHGLAQYGRQIDKVAILVDDLKLPPGISDNLTMLLPEAYAPLLDGHGKPEPILLSERKARNQASKALEKHIKRIGSEGVTPESEYNSTGFVVGYVDRAGGSGSKCSDGNLVLASPSIMDERPVSQKAVALNRKGENNNIVPSCGAFEAGKMMLCEQQGADHIIAVYHEADDAMIRLKNIDGAFIHAWLHPESQLHYTHVTLGNPQNGVVVDDYPPARLRDTSETTYRDFHAQMLMVPAIRPVTDGKSVVVSSSGERGGQSRL